MSSLGMLDADEAYFKEHKEPLFRSEASLWLFWLGRCDRAC